MPKPTTTPIIRPNKAYGDQKALDSLKRQASGMKQGNADVLPTERRGPGRPAGTGAVQPTPQAQPEAAGIPPEHIALMEDFARATAVAQTAAAAAQDPTAGPWLRMYAQYAEDELRSKGEKVRAGTPFFE